MRALTRIHAVIFFAACTIVYMGWILPSLNVQSRVQKALSGSRRRIVVFGDSWSDTGEYRVQIPAFNPQHNISRPLWTEALCEKLLCDDVDNFARASGSLDFKEHPDAFVDTDLLANATNQHPENAKFLADLRKQVGQWINFEKQKGGLPARSSKKEWTVFTVFFGISDVWQLAALEDKAAKDAVKQSIDVLFAQFDVIVEFMGGPIHVVLPKIVDITFLPAFALQPHGPFPDRQRLAVSLSEKWNTELEKAAREWTGGYVHLLETDKWFLRMIREQQMYKMGIADESGTGKSNPRFREVRNPCVPLPHVGAQYPFDMGDAGSNRTCEDASHYLFWDGMHLSGQAHKLLAVEAAELVATNNTFNINALRKHALEQEEAAQRAAQGDKGR